jgi:hypothetical protein
VGIALAELVVRKSAIKPGPAEPGLRGNMKLHEFARAAAQLYFGVAINVVALQMLAKRAADALRSAAEKLRGLA